MQRFHDIAIRFGIRFGIGVGIAFGGQTAAGTPFPPGVPVAAMIMFTQRGFQWDKHGYGLFSDALTEQSASAVELSRSQLEIVRAYSKADEGNPCYTTHLHYLQQLFGVVKEGGSVLCEHPFPRAAIEKATEFPVKLFEPLDSGWKQYAQRIQSGNLGLVLPPLLSIVMNNCARRDAIPAVVTDLRRDWAGARRKIWQLVDDQKNARTLEEVNDIDHELAEASKSLLSTSGAEGSSPLRMLWDIFAGATGGAVTAKMAGGDAKNGEAGSRIREPQVAFCLSILRCCERCNSVSGSAGFEVVGEEQTIPINSSTELYAVLTQMGYAEGEKQNIEARIAKDLDSKKIGRADWILPCPSNPESKVHLQIFDANGSEFLNWPPPWFMDAFVKGVNVTAVPANEKPGSEPRPFRVLAAFWSLPLVSFLGVVIGTTGGANLTRVRRRVQ